MRFLLLCCFFYLINAFSRVKDSKKRSNYHKSIQRKLEIFRHGNISWHVLERFAKFTGKYYHIRINFFCKIACRRLHKRFHWRCFPVNFAIFFRTVSENNSDWLFSLAGKSTIRFSNSTRNNCGTVN